jgi:hypothetical protein
MADNEELSPEEQQLQQERLRWMNAALRGVQLGLIEGLEIKSRDSRAGRLDSLQGRLNVVKNIHNHHHTLYDRETPAIVRRATEGGEIGVLDLVEHFGASLADDLRDGGNPSASDLRSNEARRQPLAEGESQAHKALIDDLRGIAVAQYYFDQARQDPNFSARYDTPQKRAAFNNEVLLLRDRR